MTFYFFPCHKRLRTIWTLLRLHRVLSVSLNYTEDIFEDCNPFPVVHPAVPDGGVY